MGRERDLPPSLPPAFSLLLLLALLPSAHLFVLPSASGLLRMPCIPLSPRRPLPSSLPPPSSSLPPSSSFLPPPSSSLLGRAAALTRTFLELNDLLHSCPGIDDTLSGTTAIAIVFIKNKMFVCNVGDSRAILAQRPRAPEPASAPPDTTAVTAPNGAAVTGRNGAELRVFPLSEDQTPYRRDERERVKRCGARVLSMDQMAGFEPLHEKWGDVRLGEAIDEAGDPPRVWSKYGEYPGTAFTRSLGDSIAEELGVYAVPEITVRKISPRDQYVMVASDGVYEFLTNKQCIQTLHEHSDPLAATQALARRAFDLWLSYEIRSDDITLICLVIDQVGAGKKEGEGGGEEGEEGEEEEEDPAWSLKTVRPLRSPRGN
ncbi:hypothetical protein NSK_005186, partial [Nannochloropsis salina CCMP1776]